MVECLRKEKINQGEFKNKILKVNPTYKLKDQISTIKKYKKALQLAGRSS